MTVTWNKDQLQRVRQACSRAVVMSVEAVRSEAIVLVLNTPKTGRVYSRRGVEHTASAPGEPPASDTGRLVGSIRADYTRLGDLAGVVRASTEYAAHLEYGTQNMEPRPFMRPALENRRADVYRIFEEQFRAVLST